MYISLIQTLNAMHTYNSVLRRASQCISVYLSPVICVRLAIVANLEEGPTT